MWELARSFGRAGDLRLHFDHLDSRLALVIFLVSAPVALLALALTLARYALALARYIGQ